MTPRGTPQARFGLALLIGVEFWERYGFYGLRALLVLFLSGAPAAAGLGWSPGRAIVVFAIYGGLSYLFPILGGWIADHHWGERRCVLTGGWLIVAGHLALAAPLALDPLIESAYGVAGQSLMRTTAGPIGDLQQEDALRASLIAVADIRHLSESAVLGAGLLSSRLTALSLLLGLLLVSVGTGFFKPGVTTLVSDLYPPNEAGRDRGFGYFYMGINGGTALGLLLCGYIGERLGWQYGLLSAAAGFSPALVIFALLEPRFLAPPAAQGRAAARAVPLTPLLPREKTQLLLLASLFPLSVIFWACLEQFGGLLTIFAREHVDRSIDGFQIPVTWMVLANPLTIILAAPVLGHLWSRLARRGANPLAADKLFASMVLVVLAYAMLAAVGAAVEAHESGKASVAWILVFYVMLAIAEVLLQPVALAEIGRLAPKRLEALCVGAWYVSLAAGGLLAGAIGSAVDQQTFTELFRRLVALACLGAVTAFVLRFWHARVLRTAGNLADNLLRPGRADRPGLQ